MDRFKAILVVLTLFVFINSILIVKIFLELDTRLEKIRWELKALRNELEGIKSLLILKIGEYDTKLREVGRSLKDIENRFRLVALRSIKAYIINEFRVSTTYYQGLARGDNYWYFSDKDAIFMVEGFNKDIYSVYPAIPEDLRSKGYNHIGDIDYFNGIIFAPLEDVYYRKPVVALYNASNLSFIRVIGPLPQSHMPWVALDSKGHIYSSEFSNVGEIKVYDMSGNLIQTIELNATLQRVQGGCILYDTYLFLSTDDGGDWIYAVDIVTGIVQRIIAVKNPYEGEGIECKGTNLFFLVGTPSDIPNRLYIVKLLPRE